MASAERASQAPVAPAWLGSWVALLAALVLGVGVDQLTKQWAANHLPGRPFQEVIPGLLELRYSLNSGVGFGLGQGLPTAYRTPALVVVTVVAMAALLEVWRRARLQPDVRAGLSLLLAGGSGNLIDRVRRGEVIDFLHLRLGESLQLGTFNLADVLIAAGLLCLLASVWRLGPG